MSRITQYLNNTVNRIYIIIALFISIILCFVLFFQFQIAALTSIRVYVGGEGLWAKAQKDAVHNLGNYAITHDEIEYQEYWRLIQVPLGDHTARVELQKANPDLGIAREGFLQGRLHPDDISYAISFFKYFQHTSYMAKAIGHWTSGDQLIDELNGIAEELHKKILSGHGSYNELKLLITRIDTINEQLTEEEYQFSSSLAEGSRWANGVSRQLTYIIAALFAVLGIVLSWPIILRINTAENALMASEERFRSIFNNAKDIVFTVAPDTTFISLNQAFETMTGWYREEWLNKPFAPILHPEDLSKANDIFQRVMREETINPFELRVQKKSGEYFIGEYTVTPMKQGNEVILLGIVRDVTERRSMENVLRESEYQLREANAAKDKFFSIISHDLKNPFNALLGSAQTLHDNADDLEKDDIKDLSSIIYRSSKSLYSLIDNLLTWAKSQLDGIDFQPRDVNLRDIVHESIKIVENQAENKHITIFNTVLGTDVHADPDLLKTIIRNLLSNAIKYTNQRGTITVSSKQVKDVLEVSIADTGVGIPPDVIDKIFRIDTKYSTPGTARESGTGLGLVLCKEFVECQGGRIWVESEVGKGTIFSFTLPVAGSEKS